MHRMTTRRTGVLGVAVVGLGVGEQHAIAYTRLASCRPPRLFDIEHDRALRIASVIPGSTVAESYEDILADPSIDVVSIASFDDAHHAQVMQALGASKHVFAEKPLCRTRSELQAIHRVWSSNKGRLKLGCNLILRAAPLFQWLKVEIASGAFGEIYAIDGDYLYGRLHKITNEWRGKVDDYSVMLGGGIHLIDLVLWLTRQRPSRVAATGNRICTSESSFRYNDFSSATLHFDSGLIGRVTANFGCVHRHQHVLRVFGTRATFILDDRGPRLVKSRDPNEPAVNLSFPALASSKGDLIPGFIAGALGELDYTDDTITAFDGISVALACDLAAKSKEQIEVEYLQ